MLHSRKKQRKPGRIAPQPSCFPSGVLRGCLAAVREPEQSGTTSGGFGIRDFGAEFEQAFCDWDCPDGRGNRRDGVAKQVRPAFLAVAAVAVGKVNERPALVDVCERMDECLLPRDEQSRRKQQSQGAGEVHCRSAI